MNKSLVVYCYKYKIDKSRRGRLYCRTLFPGVLLEYDDRYQGGKRIVLVEMNLTPLLVARSTKKSISTGSCSCRIGKNRTLAIKCVVYFGAPAVATCNGQLDFSVCCLLHHTAALVGRGLYSVQILPVLGFVNREWGRSQLPIAAPENVILCVRDYKYVLRPPKDIKVEWHTPVTLTSIPYSVLRVPLVLYMTIVDL
jgi:hypothetical protein